MGLFGNKEKNELIKAAKSGDVAAQIKLAESYAWKNDDFKFSFQDAEHWYRKAIDQGSAEALSKYAHALLSYNRIPVEQAIKMQEDAFNQGYADAADELGDIYDDDDRPGTKDVTKATYWYMMGSEAGSTLADYDYALHLLNGEGAPVDLDKAEMLFLRSIEKGIERRHKYAYMYLGIIAYRRNDHQHAIDCYIKSHNLGNTNMELLIGQEYLIVGDKENARMWFKQGASKGNSDCMRELMALQ